MRRVNMPYGIRGPILLVQVELWMLAAGSCSSLANQIAFILSLQDSDLLALTLKKDLKHF